MTTLEDEFRVAWDEAQGDTFAARLARRSLEASAEQAPELANLLFDLKNKHQAELDLHLDGEAVRDHTTNAQQFSIFVRGVADAVKEITKNALGRQRMASRLLIAAPSPGSVRMVLRAEAPVEKSGHISAARAETQDSNSLRVVATLLARADDVDAQGTVVEGLLAELAPKARPAIRRIARAVADANWEIEGTLRRAQEDPEPLHIGSAGARHLLSALDLREVERSSVTLYGQADGQRRSMGTMWFLPSVGAPIEASVIDQKLLQEVAALSASATPAKATFTVVTRYPPGTLSAGRKSYVLTAIEAKPETAIELDMSKIEN